MRKIIESMFAGLLSITGLALAQPTGSFDITIDAMISKIFRLIEGLTDLALAVLAAVFVIALILKILSPDTLPKELPRLLGALIAVVFLLKFGVALLYAIFML